MVIGDFLNSNSIEPPVENTQQTHINDVANPFDRLAAFIIDYVVICGMLIVPVTTSVIVKNISTLSMIGDNEAVITMVFLYCFSVFMVVISYSFISNLFFDSTVGKKAMKLKIVNSWTGELPPVSSLILREIIKITQVLLFFPMLILISSKKRRMLHDRVCETSVISLKKHQSTPSPAEFLFARGFYVGFFILFIISLIVPVSKLIYSDVASSSSVFENIDRGCRSVSGSLANMTTKVKPARIELALSLYISKAISSTCFKQEVNLSLAESKDKNMAYLSKLLLLSESGSTKSLIDSYVDPICRVNNSEACEMAKIQQHTIPWFTKSPKSIYGHVWAVNKLLAGEDFSKLDGFLEKDFGVPEIGTFILEAKIKNLWAFKQFNQVEMLLKHLAPTLSVKSRQRNLKWTCFRGLMKSCDYSRSYACSFYQGEGNSELSSLINLKKSTCSGGVDLQDINLTSSTKVVKKLAHAFRLKNINSGKGLIRIMNNDELSSNVRHLAAELLVDSSIKKNDLNTVYAFWKEHENSLNWESIGEKLVDSFFTMKSYAAVSKISMRLQQYLPLNTDTAKPAIIAMYNLKNYDSAWKLAQTHKRELQIESQLRAPANAAVDSTELLQVLKKLNARYGRL